MNRLPTHRLFQIKLLRNAVSQFQFPDDLEAKHKVIERWIETDRSGTLAKISEVQLHGEFLGDIFRNLLGYGTITQTQGKTWELYAEASITDKGGRADAALGLFSAVKGSKGNVQLEGRIVALIELKGAKTNLDEKQGKNPSPIDQGWSYANHTPNCRWVIVSNYREIRLYSTSKSTGYYQLFTLEDIEAIRQHKPKTSGDLSPKGLKAVEEVYQEYAIPMQIDRAEATRLEHRLSNLVNQAYQLTPEEIALMWLTAPPRMPIDNPQNILSN